MKVERMFTFDDWRDDIGTCMFLTHKDEAGAVPCSDFTKVVEGLITGHNLETIITLVRVEWVEYADDGKDLLVILRQTDTVADAYELSNFLEACSTIGIDRGSGVYVSFLNTEEE